MNRKLLAIYLNDHLAGSAGAIELTGRSLGANRGTELGAFLERLRGEIEQDRRALEELMGRLNIQADRLKLAAAWAAEKAGRLKTNGALTGYSPLSRLVELEALSTGVQGKLALWQGLQEVAEDPALAGFDSEPLIERARAQLAELERHRRSAARLALAEGG